MRVWGRLVGSLIGALAGLPGILFGFLVGFLIDRATENRGRLVRYQRFLARPEDTGVDRPSGILFSTLGLLSAAGGPPEWSTEYLELLVATGAKPVPDDERKALSATADVQGGGMSLPGVLGWLRRNMAVEEAAALATLLLMPQNRKGDTTIRRVGIALQVADTFVLSSQIRQRIWDNGRPIGFETVALLDVSQSASPREIQRVYRLLAAQFHPDSLSGLEESQRKEATEAFVRVRSAFDRVHPLAEAWFAEA